MCLSGNVIVARVITRIHFAGSECKSDVMCALLKCHNNFPPFLILGIGRYLYLKYRKECRK
nr:MAG TPA: hypothetical protein [Caudoviricetes sp.]